MFGHAQTIFGSLKFREARKKRFPYGEKFFRAAKTISGRAKSFSRWRKRFPLGENVFHACRSFQAPTRHYFVLARSSALSNLTRLTSNCECQPSLEAANKKGRLPSFSRKAGPGFSPLNRDQNWYRSANWIKRGFIEVAVINPKFGELG